jgi:hypothetical protein
MIRHHPTLGNSCMKLWQFARLQASIICSSVTESIPSVAPSAKLSRIDMLNSVGSWLTTPKRLIKIDSVMKLE